MKKIEAVKKDELYHDLLNDSNMDIIEFIVMQILGESYDEVHGNCLVSNSRLSRIDIKDRVKYSDLIISYKEYDIIIELNNNFDGNLKRNILFALTRLVKFYSKYETNKSKMKKINLNEEDALEKLRELRKRQNDYKNNYYKDVFKVILVNLNWYHDGSESIKYQRQEVIFDNPDKGIFLKVININLDKYAKMPYNEIKKEEQFYKLLTIDNYEELIKFTNGNKLLDRYVSDLIKFSKNPKEEDDNNMDMGIELHFRDEAIYDLGEANGLKKGLKQGIEQGKQDMVLTMYDEKEPLDKIAKYSKLSLNKIKEIIKSSKININKK